ncbi:hypothetical protein DSM110093_03819 (plasmid) [Sulfitobacter sp. DSM 110093]|nr:hypothetical protein DSM110093_03558 [Sulfitobacter sp. DSM 110093]UOA33984.1 hypothetical protein DSM110093_03819 [Sulfitobacter sp. DSM 110093]
MRIGEDSFANSLSNPNLVRDLIFCRHPPCDLFALENTLGLAMIDQKQAAIYDRYIYIKSHMRR